MAALCLLPSFSSTISRNELQESPVKSSVYLPFCIEDSKCNIKLPHSAVVKMKCFTRTPSVDLQGFSAERSMTLLDSSSNSMNDFERQLQEFFVEVKTLIKTGNLDDAIHLLQANYEAVKEQIDGGVKGMEQAALLDVIALGFLGVGDFEFVEFLLDMLNQIVGNIKSDEPFLDSVLLHMGSMYTNLGKFDNAMNMYNRALEILEGLFGKSSPFLVTPLLALAKVSTSSGRASKAVDIYHRTIHILEMSRGHVSEEVVMPLSGLGNLLIKEGKVADAENCFSRISKIYAKLYGDHDGRVGMAMCSVANAKCAKGDINEAIKLYREGLEIIKDSNYIPLDDEVVEKIRIDLAELLHIAGRAQEGRELLEECLLITEKYKGSEHPSSVTHLLNLATSYSRSKNYVEAERLLRMGLGIMKTAVGLDDQSITVPMLQLAVVLYHLQQDMEAEYFALEALRIRERSFGKDSLLVGEALDCLVCIQVRLGKDDGEILGLLERVLSIQERELGWESEEVMITLNKIVFYLEKQGRRVEMRPLQRRLSLLRTKYKNKVHY